jgi:hypothetical protein
MRVVVPGWFGDGLEQRGCDVSVVFVTRCQFSYGCPVDFEGPIRECPEVLLCLVSAGGVRMNGEGPRHKVCFLARLLPRRMCPARMEGR